MILQMLIWCSLLMFLLSSSYDYYDYDSGDPDDSSIIVLHTQCKEMLVSPCCCRSLGIMMVMPTTSNSTNSIIRRVLVLLVVLKLVIVVQ